jgi:hypothetical protein
MSIYKLQFTNQWTYTLNQSNCVEKKMNELHTTEYQLMDLQADSEQLGKTK